MAKLPLMAQPDELSTAIDKAISDDQDMMPRKHLGGSIIGKNCSRQIWYGFRWTTFKRFDGRILRLFRRGHNEEHTINSDLRAIGIDVSELSPQGHQWRVSECHGHFGGSLDARLKNVPAAPKTEHVGEYKTHGDKSFKALQKHMVKESKPQHWVQMQVYMYLSKIKRALYVAINKNTDHYYTERVKLDVPAAKAAIEKANVIIFGGDIPQKLSESPAYFECKFCDETEVCHGQGVPAPTCRSCSFAQPAKTGDGVWHCSKFEKDLSYQDQVGGCQSHVFIPALLQNIAEFTGFDIDSGVTSYKHKHSGKAFHNGPRNENNTYSSAELYELSGSTALLGDENFNDLRDFFGATVVGTNTDD